MTAEDLEAAAARVIAEGAVPIAELAKLVPTERPGEARGDRASASTLTRWIETGKYGVRLDGARLGGRGWCSSVQALARFAAAVARARRRHAVAVAEPCARERRAQAAVAELRRLRGKG